jgi:signal transduction histidine kinase
VASENTERLGVFAHELRYLLNNALLAYEALKTGTSRNREQHGMMLGRNLLGLRDLIDRSLAEVRIEAGTNLRERVSLSDFIEEVEVAATIQARADGHDLHSPSVDKRVASISSAANGSRPRAICCRTLQVHPPGWPRGPAHRHDDAAQPGVDRGGGRCGGLPAGFGDRLFQPFHQQGADRSGLGLG